MRCSKGVPAPFGEPKHIVLCDFLTKSNAARAKDTAFVIKRDARTDLHSFRFLDLVLEKARVRAAIFDTEFLEATFARLIADGAVQWMIDEQKFHDATATFLDQRRTRAQANAFGNILRAANLRTRHPVDDRLTIGAQLKLPVGPHPRQTHF